MTSRGELHELAADKSVEETHAAGLEPVRQVWRHSVIGVAPTLELHLQDKGASVVGQDLHGRTGLEFTLPIPPTARQRKSNAWNRHDRVATMTARQVFDLFNWAGYRDANEEPLTHNLDFITLVMLATARSVEVAK